MSLPVDGEYKDEERTSRCEKRGGAGGNVTGISNPSNPSTPLQFRQKRALETDVMSNEKASTRYFNPHWPEPNR